MTNLSADGLRQTPLYALHQSLDARMVPFAGYSMPVQFEGVKAEHLHTREAAGMFDVSHMGQVLVRGQNVAQQLESLVPVDLVDLPTNHQTYALLTNHRGGVLDDLMICRWQQECFMLVVNAGCKETDLAWMNQNLPEADIELCDDKALLALQGPAAAQVLETLVPGTSELRFMTGDHFEWDGAALYITRSGYTGEDGFEISLPGAQADSFAKLLLAHEQVKPVGLGARDTLRLEAGMCLYGHELIDTITPVTAALGWSISKARRSGGQREGGFPGAATILQEVAVGTPEKRVGLAVNGKAPVREGAQLVDEHNKLIGRVTSGGFGPSVNAPIAMGFIQSAYANIGTQVSAIVRGRNLPVTITPLPFVPNRFVR